MVRNHLDVTTAENSPYLHLIPSTPSLWNRNGFSPSLAFMWLKSERMLRPAFTSRFQSVKHVSFLHTLRAQNRDGPSIRSSHPEHMMLVRNSSTFLTRPLNLLFSSRYNPFTGPDAWPRELLENRASPNATTVVGSSAVIRRQTSSYAFARLMWDFQRSLRHRAAPWNSRNASR